jgi:hypothetical protein
VADCENAGGTACGRVACGTREPDRCVPFNNPPVCCNVSINGADACANPVPLADCVNAGGTAFTGGRGTLEPDRCARPATRRGAWLCTR